MKVRFQADADLNEHILLATLRRQPEVDFKTAMAAELAAVEDREVLERCLIDGRILVTHDRKTMPLHFYKLIEQGESSGVIVVPQADCDGSRGVEGPHRISASVDTKSG